MTLPAQGPTCVPDAEETSSARVEYAFGNSPVLKIDIELGRLSKDL